jgi:hypothetical protein
VNDAASPATRSVAPLLAGSAGLVALLVVFESPTALAIVLTDGLAALAILAGAGLAGAAVLGRAGLLAESRPARFVYGAGLGVGALALMQLGLGLLGWLSRPGWIAAYAVLLALGLGPSVPGVIRTLRANRSMAWPDVERRQWLWAAVVPFLALALLVATAPPGVLWSAEGNGYDVREYHLAVPKAWLEAGRITFLPHNVYSNFPANAEMLYLTAMVLKGDPIAGIELAKMFNAMLAVLAVAAVWAAARPYGARAATVAGVLAGTCGWFVYLSGVAYVENAMLLFTALALGAWVRWWRATDRSMASRWALLAGVFAGLACGCKYTAVVLVAAPLGVAMLFRVRRGAVAALRDAFVFGLAGLVAFAPWLARNIANTRNPVFPLAASVIGYSPGVWDAASAARWQAGHQPPPAARSFLGRLDATWRGVLADRRTGPVVWLLLLAAVVLRLGFTWPFALILLMQWVAWAGLTHLVDRFAVPLLPVAFVLIAPALVDATPRRGTFVFVAVLAGAVLNLYAISALYYHHTRLPTTDSLTQRVPWFGRTDWFVQGEWPGTAHLGYINRELPSDARVLLVAEARTLYLQRSCDTATIFNEHPLAKAVRQIGDAAGVLAWLGEQGYTHVYVDWIEMNRLRQTYGFWPGLDELLLARLENAGLRRVEDFAVRAGGPVYATLYEGPQ